MRRINRTNYMRVYTAITQRFVFASAKRVCRSKLQERRRINPLFEKKKEKNSNDRQKINYYGTTYQN